MVTFEKIQFSRFDMTADAERLNLRGNSQGKAFPNLYEEIANRAKNRASTLPSKKNLSTLLLNPVLDTFGVMNSQVQLKKQDAWASS